MQLLRQLVVQQLEALESLKLNNYLIQATATRFNLVKMKVEINVLPCYTFNIIIVKFIFKSVLYKETVMLRRELQDLLEILGPKEYCTAVHLAELLGVSEKTARLRIKELDRYLKDYGALIASKARYGYQLVVHDETKFSSLKVHEEPSRIPETGQERSEYLLAYLIWRRDYVKSEDLCDFLYVSKTTLTRSLKSVEAILKRYSLRLERRPNYGIRLQGEEIDIRRLFSDYFIKRNCLEDVNVHYIEQELHQLAARIRELLITYDIRLSENAFANFVEYVYVAWKRIQHGHYLEMKIDDIPELGCKEHAFIKELITLLEKDSDIRYTKEEEQYLFLYLAGKRMIGNVVENETNFVIHERTDRLALAMLDVVNQVYYMDFHNNFDVRMTLNQHLVPFDIRMRFDIPFTNPLLAEIKENYSLAFQMSQEAVHVLRDFYKKEISEDEIGYFALIFELAMEKDRKGERADILVVCSTGKGSSRLLKYKYEQEFSDYLNNIYVCDLLELEDFDFSKVQFIFTTVPITKKVPVPIVEVGVFLGDEDIRKVTDVLRRGNSDYLKRYYQPKRFLANLKGETKEEVLEAICNLIIKQEDVDADFFELVLEREAYIQMDYGYQIAIPHPNRIASSETFAYVAVLERPIIWNSNPVQLVVLSSVGRRKDRNRQKFYEATARFSLSKSSIQKLIDTPEYEVLMELLQE